MQSGRMAWGSARSPLGGSARPRGAPLDTRSAWLRQQVSAVLVIAVALVCVACASDPVRPIDPERHLYDPNPGRRMEAIATVRATRDTRHLPRLVELLDDADPGVRAFSIQTLEELTGRTSAYAAYAEASDRRAEVKAWEAWLASQGEKSAEGTR